LLFQVIFVDNQDPVQQNQPTAFARRVTAPTRYVPARESPLPVRHERGGLGRGENSSGQTPLPSPLLLRASGGEGVNCRPLPTKCFVPRPLGARLHSRKSGIVAADVRRLRSKSEFRIPNSDI